jgi:hypothetical protein
VGKEHVITQADGTMICTVQPGARKEKRPREWKEMRPMVAQAKDSATTVYGATFGSVAETGRRWGHCTRAAGWDLNNRKRVLYSTFDVTTDLQKGQNAIGIMLGNSWFNPLPLRMDGILDNGISDHESLVPKPRALSGTAFYFFNVKLFAQLANALGKTTDAAEAETAAARIRAAFNHTFLQPGSGRYDFASQACQAIALDHGLVAADEQPRGSRLRHRQPTHVPWLGLHAGPRGDDALGTLGIQRQHLLA